MKTKAQMWGNSLAIRIPKGIAQELNISANDPLNITVIDGNVVVAPEEHRKTYQLDVLLKGITKRNLHGEEDSGQPMGHELL